MERIYYGLSFVLALVTAFVLQHVMALSMYFYQPATSTLTSSAYSYPAIQTGITSAFWMWLGFVMPVQATTTIFGSCFSLIPWHN